MGERQRVKFAMGTGEHAPVTEDTVALRQDELAQVVHDLKNPLSSIALEAELLEARMEFAERADVVLAANRILRNVTYLDRLVHELMDACILSTGRLTLRRTVCDLGRMVMAVVDRVVPLAERHRVFLDAREGVPVVIDELRIERVVSNLLDNALKYTPQSAGIVIGVESRDHTVQVSVSDAGPGLSASEAETIFDPYRRGSTSRGRTGTGLGLHVSKQIVEAHGGRIGLETQRGYGARFYFELPVD